MIDRKPVTLADLKASTFSMQMHARLGKGGFLRAVVGVEFPRVSISTSRASARDPVIRTLFVDDVECATLDQVLERLNAPTPEAS